MAIRFLLLAALAIGAPARAMQFDVGPDGEIVATGPIVPGDSQRLRDVVDRLPPDTAIAGLRISSPGGNVREAEVLAAAIRAARLPVTVGAGSDCASACFLIFAAAADRRVGRSARVGVHSASVNGQDTASAMAITTELARRAGTYGVPPEIIGKLVTTGPRQITWLTQMDLASMGVLQVR